MSLARFGVRRPVPVNLLMFALIMGGLFSALTMRREFFPEVDSQAARITMPYPGASPEEIEESMVRKVEDAIADLDDIKKIETTVVEGLGTVMVEFVDGANVDELMDDLDRTIDALQDLPTEAEEIQVVEFEPNLPVIMLTLWGDADEESMKRAIRRIADDLQLLPGMGRVLVSGVRDYEIRIDVDRDALVRLGISLPRVSEAVRAWMVEIPSGVLRTRDGNLTVRTMGVEESADPMREIVVAARPDGSTVRLGDVAAVTESYVDDQLIRRFNGAPGVSVTVFRVGDQDAIDIAEMVRAYAAGRLGEPFPGGMFDHVLHAGRVEAWRMGHDHPDVLPADLSLHSDLARFIEGRLDLLTRNAGQGAILVFVALLLVLNVRAAWWVMVGLFTAICGTLIAMSVLDITLNLLTMFGLLVTLGMLTDDAIVVAENIMSRHEKGEPADEAAINGGNEVLLPVLGTVSTTIVAFMPLMFIQGQIGELLGALPWVVLCALAVSFVESMLILPSHMRHAMEHADRAKQGPISRALGTYAHWRDRNVIARVVDWYSSGLRACLRFRYLTTITALAVLIASLGMVAGERVPFEFLPASDSETVVVEVRMPIGTPIEGTLALADRIALAARDLPETQSVSTVIGETADVETGVATPASPHLGQVFIELFPVEDRDRESADVIDSIRLAAGDLSAAEQISFQEITGGPAGADLTVEVAGNDRVAVNAVVDEVKALMASFDGVYGIADDDFDSQRELQVRLRPGAAALGLTVGDIALQLRGALFGLEPHVFSRDREDIDVRVRLDETSRRRIDAIDDLWVATPDGRSVPLTEVATITEASAYAAIRRIDRERAVTVTADCAVGINPEVIAREMATPLAAIGESARGVTIRSGGRQADVADAFSTLPIAFAAAMLLIYVILASLFSSYVQPFAVMLAIPFGIIGVVWGHWLLGYEMTFLSLIGFVALAGVVVNNSLILVDFYNRYRAEGLELRDALVEAGRQRLRPIVLTTTTTVLGLSPLMLEQSFQAKFLIPMAISISAGLISSTVLTLVVLPSMLVIFDDLRELAHCAWYAETRTQRATRLAAEDRRDDDDHADGGDEGRGGDGRRQPVHRASGERSPALDVAVARTTSAPPSAPGDSSALAGG